MSDAGDSTADTADWWDQRWREGHTPWDRGGVNPALEAWLTAEAVSGPRVLVPGAGSGHEVAALARAGFQVTAVDISATACRQLQRTLALAGLTADVVTADLLSWEPDAPFDSVYEQTALCALNPAHWEAYEARLARWIRTGGVLLALFMHTGRPGGPPFHCGLEEMQSLFSDRRWHWPQPPYTQIPFMEDGWYELAVRLERR